MSVELLINITPSETRVAQIENGMLQELHLERQSTVGIVGNIYLGKVSRVLPGMQAAFVDIGMEKAAFLHASDIISYDHEKDQLTPKSNSVRDIVDLVREGQKIIVQVVKDPLGTKGARLTTDITLPSRYLVFMPDSKHVGVSQRIDNEAERQRLKSIVEDHYEEGNGGFIVRTAAEGAGEKELAQDAVFLKKLWNKIIKKKKKTRNQAVLYEDLSLAFRIIRDFVAEELERVRIDSKLTFGELTAFTEEFSPELTKKLEYYPGERPIFDMFGVESEIKRALDKKVDLKSGGYLVIDQTEAMTTIDVNTGAFVGHRSLEDTIFNTNSEATQAIARQLRLRNLGGIIIIDFIDMLSTDHQKRVLHSLEIALSKDRAKNNVHGFSALGLVEMTRKRTRESLEHVLCSECEVCNGRGYVKSVETICAELLREIVRVNRAYDADKFIVYASTAVAESLENDEFHNLAELEVFIGKQIKVKTESLYNQDQFDVVMM
ncbi:ribonuclease G [Psychrosphaera saromensis]|uniref:Ribonuclease G n=1 Tax=Psychrosphaera saromensis TaxID=716813 RepID=A0A2S7UUY6_9GAMM|nr:ribonuclease G [Psychrosphaera saromensis]PQJ53080.1 ribonuclease E/G [Psychrosphaera saromensis]GHB68238.1 ribonuclease G [Psychrosphaera saromensis]GLQ15168.1 ribonuclease G [Psychrosphaera saromensis]